MRALKREICRRCRPTLASRNDVIDVKNRGLTELQELTVTAARLIPLKHRFAQRFGDGR
jgi:hypothetical protein